MARLRGALPSDGGGASIASVELKRTDGHLASRLTLREVSASDDERCIAPASCVKGGNETERQEAPAEA
jgi:hypothetical protein